MEKYFKNLPSTVGSFSLSPLGVDGAFVSLIIPTAFHNRHELVVRIDYHEIVPFQAKYTRFDATAPLSNIY